MTVVPLPTNGSSTSASGVAGYALDPDNAGRRRFRFIAQENVEPYALTIAELPEDREADVVVISEANVCIGGAEAADEDVVAGAARDVVIAVAAVHDVALADQDHRLQLRQVRADLLDQAQRGVVVERDQVIDAFPLLQHAQARGGRLACILRARQQVIGVQARMSVGRAHSLEVTRPGLEGDDAIDPSGAVMMPTSLNPVERGANSCPLPVLCA